MKVLFANATLRTRCNSRKKALKAWGQKRADLVNLRLDDIQAAQSLDDLRHTPGDLHEYRHKKDYSLTLDLDGGNRLFFRPVNKPTPVLADGVSLDWTRVDTVEILKIGDFHGKPRR